MESEYETDSSGTEPDRQSGGQTESARRDSFRHKLPSLRPLLRALAAELLHGDVAARVDPSDVVQETMARAADQIGQFQGTSDSEFSAWVQQILRRNVIDSIRFHTSEKRDVRRESALGGELTSGSASPSSAIQRMEDFARITQALSELRDDQRQVVALRSEGLPFDEIGRRMGRSTDAARMLWGRTILQLGKLLKAHDSAHD